MSRKPGVTRSLRGLIKVLIVLAEYYYRLFSANLSIKGRTKPCRWVGGRLGRFKCSRLTVTAVLKTSINGDVTK